jgi:hypothetical protein
MWNSVLVHTESVYVCALLDEVFPNLYVAAARSHVQCSIIVPIYLPAESQLDIRLDQDIPIALTSAPCSTRNFTSSMWPFVDAICKAVRLFSPVVEMCIKWIWKLPRGHTDTVNIRALLDKEFQNLSATVI